MRIILGGLFAIALMTPAPALSQAAVARYQVPPVREDGWKTANADALGVDSTKLANLTTAIRSWPELGVHFTVGRSQYRNAVASGPRWGALTTVQESQYPYAVAAGQPFVDTPWSHCQDSHRPNSVSSSSPCGTTPRHLSHTSSHFAPMALGSTAITAVRSIVFTINTARPTFRQTTVGIATINSSLGPPH